MINGITRARLMATTVIAGAIMAGAPLQAQSVTTAPEASADGETGGDIVVTGSRIARRDLTSSSPLTTVSSEEFQLSGAVNVEQVLNTLPQVLPGTTSFSNNPGSGAVTLNLRNLGTTRTLVLVNGRRWMFYDTSQIVDLNTIPQFMLEGVDVVTGGQSAVYGSDAIGGVANFRLKKLNGIQMGANYTVTGSGDGPRYSFDLGIGSDFADNRGNVTLYANYTRRSPVFASERGFSRFAAQDGCIVSGSTNGLTGLGTNLGGALATCASRGGQVGLIRGGSATGPIATLQNLNLIFNPTGGGTRTFQDPGDLYNFAPDNYLQLPQERYLIGGYGSYEITDGIEAYTELSFINNSVPQELAPTPTGVTAVLQVNSPFFNAATQSTLRALDTDADGYVSTGVGFRFNQSGPRNADQNRTAFRVLGGLRGNLTEKLRYDAFYSYSRTRNTIFQQGNISTSRYLAALNTETVGGVLRCRDTAARTAGCLPLNVFGQGLADPAAIRYVTINSTNIYLSDLKNAVASVSGELFNLGLGADDIGFALGGEYRGMSSRYIPDTFLASGDVLGFNAGQPTRGSYNAKEIFGEISIPVLKDSFIHSLSFNGAGRYSDYSLGNVGGVWTYAAGGEFAPIPDITFRGNYQRSVRAPNVEDLFGGNSTGFPGATDPCSDRGTAASRTAALRALCVASGVPAALVFTRQVQPNAQIQANFGGNPNLEEETSDTYTVGAVIRPRFVPRLNITVDYFNITVDNTISTFGGGLSSTLSLCYTVAQNLSNSICGPILGTRNAATGAIGLTSGGTNPNILSANIGKLETSGIDVAVDYNLPLGFSLLGDGSARFSMSFQGTYLDKFRSTPVAAIPERVNVLEGRASGNPLPRWKHTARYTLSDGPATVSLRWRYHGSAYNPSIYNTFVGLTRVVQNPAEFSTVKYKAVNYFDLTFSFEASDNLSLTGGINNILRKLPQVAGSYSEQNNTYPGSYDVLGRDFFISAKMKF
ncbi:TonB-dependent receptor [Sphingomonas naphthae]|uniref:TonB-dependent receptor n=1 Tax=Sphingomonas naphthae TaxID=1813468 RepID=A0ABY7TH12_9SPHN|nr:TonB-dependent receptor [Sphingomonas naphthae]WCT72440.1 TonB-dependent receptor [Sphingomonas naphthae]